MIQTIMKRTGILWVILAMLLIPAFAVARITQIKISSTQSPTFDGVSFGTVGQYEKLIGTVKGEVDPNDPRNEVIVDIKLAPRNTRGMVEYSTDILILRPKDPSKGNRRLVYDVTNRGNANTLNIWNDSDTGNNPTSAADAGNGYLMHNGWIVLISGWDFSAPCATPPNCGPDKASANFTATVPVATNPDGSPITGLNTDEFVVDTGSSPTTFTLTYAAASLDKSKASLTMRRRYTDTPISIPESGWDYTNSAGTAIKLVPGPFVATNLYEFTYTAINPRVGGLGFAALRDIAAFVRDANRDDDGNPNPLAGLIDFLYTSCSSQPCRTTRDFVALGFNEADSGPLGNHKGKANEKFKGKGHQKHVQVFDGILNWKGGGSGIFLNYRFGQPVRTHRQHIARWTPEILFPFANETIHDPVTGDTAGRLDRCTETNTCPKIFEANSSNEFWAKAASNLLTDANDRDIKEASNVRYYLESSSPHGAASGLGICAQPRNPLGPDQLLRALLVALDEWASLGKPPPRSRVPRVADGTLVPPLPQTGAGFPNIPGVTYNGVLHTGDLFDFGPRLGAGILDILPPILISDSLYPALVPKTDADGNEIAGVRLPDIEVPLATYTGWNLRADGGGDGCDASGMKIDFAKTKDARLATGDPRLSIEERYPDHATYVDLVTKSAQRLQSQRFLLEEDVQDYIAAAQAASVP